MSAVASEMYANALGGITNALYYKANRDDRLAQQGIENQRHEKQDARANESHAMQQKIYQSQLDHEDQKQSLNWYNGASIALDKGGHVGMEAYAKSDMASTSKYGKEFAAMYGSADKLADSAAAATRVAELAKQFTSPASLQYMKEQGLFESSPDSPTKGLYVEPAKNFDARTLADLSKVQTGPKDRDANKKFPQSDGSYTQYALNTEGKPMIAGVGVNEQGGITTILTMNQYDKDGKFIKTIDVPSTVGQSADPDAKLSFGYQGDFDKRAEGLQIGTISAFMSAQTARLDPASARKALDSIEKKKETTASWEKLDSTITQYSQSKDPREQLLGTLGQMYKELGSSPEPFMAEAFKLKSGAITNQEALDEGQATLSIYGAVAGMDRKAGTAYLSKLGKDKDKIKASAATKLIPHFEHHWSAQEAAASNERTARIKASSGGSGPSIKAEKLADSFMKMSIPKTGVDGKPSYSRITRGDAEEYAAAETALKSPGGGFVRVSDSAGNNFVLPVALVKHAVGKNGAVTVQSDTKTKQLRYTIDPHRMPVELRSKLLRLPPPELVANKEAVEEKTRTY